MLRFEGLRLTVLMARAALCVYRYRPGVVDPRRTVSEPIDTVGKQVQAGDDGLCSQLDILLVKRAVRRIV